MMQRIQKAMGKRGVAMVEYAVLLAFVCVVAAIYMGSGSSKLNTAISKRVESTVSVINN